MKLFTILALLIGVFAVIFASQNSAPVAIYLMSFGYQASIGLIVFLAFAAGVVVEIFVSIPPMIGRMRKISALRNRVEDQNQEIERLNIDLGKHKMNDFPPHLESR